MARQFADKKGRIYETIFGKFGILIFGLLSAAVHHYWSIVIIRNLVGFSIGLTMPPAYAYVIEISPAIFIGTMTAVSFK